VAIKGTVVLAAACLVTLAMRNRSAASRHLVWTACAAALIALPLLSIALPALRLPAAGAFLPGDPGLVFRSTVTALPGAGAHATPPSRGPVPAARAAAPARDWRTAVLVVWALGALAVLVQMLVACLALRRLSRAARPYPEARQAALLANTLGIQSPVRVLETASGMPMTFGLLHPTICLPAASAQWSDARRRIVLLHELAHVRRGDAATHLMARVAVAMNWWNPLAWTAWHEFLKERERAADDLVLTAGAGQSEYAGHLLEVARTMQSAPSTAAAAIAMARPSQLEGRLLAILADGINRRQPGRGAALIAAAVAVAIVLPLAALRAQSTAVPVVPPEVDAAIRAATAQKNHELLEGAANTYESMRKWKEAQVLREASLAIREQETGRQSPQYAEGLVKLGDLARKRGALPESHDYYLRALELGDRPEVISALINLGLDAYRTTDKNQAFDYLQRARNIAKDGNDLGRATTWLAFMKESDPANSAEVDSLYRGAIAAEGSESAEQALTLEFYGRFLKSQGRDSEAEPVDARAAGIRKARAASLGSKRTPASSALRVGGAVSAPKLLTKIEPEYSEDARAAKFQGTVLLRIVVDVDGTATDVQVIKSLGFGLDEKAVQALARWTFKPGEMNGVPVPVLANVEVNFRLM
jgi:TonB family protein